MAATCRRVNMKAVAGYQIILLGEQRHIGMNNLPQGVLEIPSKCPGISQCMESGHPAYLLSVGVS